MLQIKFITILIVLIISAYPEERGQNIPVWMFEDALSEKPLKIDAASITSPENLAEAAEKYSNGEYSLAFEELQKVHELHLYTGKADIATIMLAEIARLLGMKHKAYQYYRYIIDYFPESRKSPAACYRILQLASEERDSEQADSMFSIIQNRYRSHPLYKYAVFSLGKLYFLSERYGEARELLNELDKDFKWINRARYIAALADIQLNNKKKALLTCNRILNESVNDTLVSEVSVLIGDIYFEDEKYETALEYYRQVPEWSTKADYSKIKEVKCCINLKRYDAGAEIAEDYINDNGKNFFEMASVLRNIYKEQDNKREERRLNKNIFKKNADERLRFGLREELILIQNDIREWQNIKNRAVKEGNDYLKELAELNTRKFIELREKCFRMLGDLEDIDSPQEEINNLALRRYILLLSDSINVLDKRIADDKSSADSSADADSVQLSEEEQLSEIRSTYKNLIEISGQSSFETESKEMKARYLDWRFIEYQKNRENLSERHSQTSGDKKEDSKAAQTFQKDVIQKLEKNIKQKRDELSNQMQLYVSANPKGRYTPQILYRMAELEYHKATEEFNKNLLRYEKALEKEGDTSDLDIEYPEFDLSEVIRDYDRIIRHFPDGVTADNAYFYKAMAFKKLDKEEKANKILMELVENYPESEFYVEANMEIGEYYFNHPQLDGGRGYTYAEDAYRRVLAYRDHPQFVNALYYLGWCYYMQDKYNQAISVFKYLVEEVDINFSDLHAQNKELTNPLLREEAIDYIAISFNEMGNTEDALKFLKLIGNPQYSSKVLMRMGEFQEENLEYESAVSLYRTLLNKYPETRIAPEAAFRMIKILMNNDKQEAAMKARKNFFTSFKKGNNWNSTMARKDSLRAAEVDSMVITTGLFIADEWYRQSEKSDNKVPLLSKAEEWYKKVSEAYPEHPLAVEALWNAASLQEKDLAKSSEAFKNYIRLSEIQAAPEKKREEAALNAIAISQEMMPSDSQIQKDKLDNAAEHALKGFKNYLLKFPDSERTPEIMMSMGDLYFNRELYGKARKIYTGILDREDLQDSLHVKSSTRIALCFFGEEKWKRASEEFETALRLTDDPEIKKKYTRKMLQAKFKYAEKLFEDQKHKEAASEFRSIDENYPGNEYGAIVLFNAGEAYLKADDLSSSEESYLDIGRKYPESELAPDALFNAASNNDENGKYKRAIQIYNKLAEKYPESERAKDALFNIGLCYKSLDMPDKMAEANERYARKYPGEEDVSALLLRSADYYMDTKKFTKAEKAYQNFIKRYQDSPYIIEAMYKSGKCALSRGDSSAALEYFSNAEEKHEEALSNDKEGDGYNAGEAAFCRGSIFFTRASSIDFSDVPASETDKAQGKKAEYLKKSRKAFQRVIRYKSSKAFEAQFKIGKLYTEYALSWTNRNLEGETPVKRAVKEQDTYSFASGLFKKGADEFRTLISIADTSDSLQQIWYKRGIEAYKNSLKKRLETLEIASEAILNAPIPEDIKSRPLYRFQYEKKLINTVAPLKTKLRDAYYDAYQEVKKAGLSDKIKKILLTEFAKHSYRIPRKYEDLAERILNASDHLPDSLSLEERDNLVFQFEDMNFILQDKALFEYEDAKALMEEKGADKTKWYTATLKRLAILAPDQYGDMFFVDKSFYTDGTWVYRKNDDEGWDSWDFPEKGWHSVYVTDKRIDRDLKSKYPRIKLITTETGKGTFYLRKNIFVPGKVINATMNIYPTCESRIYINGELYTNSVPGKTSLYSGVESVLKGGKNIIAAALEGGDQEKDYLALGIKLKLDTTLSFEKDLKEIPVPKGEPTDTLRDTPSDTEGMDNKTEAERGKGAQKENQGRNQELSSQDLTERIARQSEKTRKYREKIKNEEAMIQETESELNQVEDRLKQIKRDLQELKRGKQNIKRTE